MRSTAGNVFISVFNSSARLFTSCNCACIFWMSGSSTSAVQVCVLYSNSLAYSSAADFLHVLQCILHCSFPLFSDLLGRTGHCPSFQLCYLRLKSLYCATKPGYFILNWSRRKYWNDAFAYSNFQNMARRSVPLSC